MIYKLLLISFLLSACQKAIDSYPEAELQVVQFWTDYQNIGGVDVFISEKRSGKLAWAMNLEYCAEEPACGEGTEEHLFWAIPNLPYIAHYYGNELNPRQLIDTPFMVKENSGCTIINLNN